MLIWGVLGFKIVKTISPKNHQAPKNEVVDQFRPLEIAKRDTFSILANYRDPFLGIMPIPKSPKKKSLKTNTNFTKVPDKKILYTGYITESTTKNKIFFISIDGQQHMMEVKDIIDDVRLLSGSTKKVMVKYNGKIVHIDITE